MYRYNNDVEIQKIDLFFLMIFLKVWTRLSVIVALIDIIYPLYTLYTGEYKYKCDWTLYVFVYLLIFQGIGVMVVFVLVI